MNCPSSPGSPATLSLATIETVVVSSSVIVTAAVSLLPSIVTSVSSVPVKTMTTVSLSSKIESSTTSISIVTLVCPARTVAVREMVAKSPPSFAVPRTSKLMMVSLSLSCDMVIVNWPSSLDSAADGSFAEIDTVAVSSSVSVMFATEAVVSRVACGSPDAMLVKVRITVSLSSKIESSITPMSIVADVWPARIVTVPEVAA